MASPSVDEKHDLAQSASPSITTPSTPSAPREAPPTGFKFRHLWSPPILNPLNDKSYTLPLLYLKSPYARNFHLAWLGFFVAFLSWFAFPPLFPEAITKDLKLTKAEVANSNIVALCATLIVRLFIGIAVDRYGPRYIMAGILIAGAIPSGLASVISGKTGLYVIRFFIGILGATFVPCVVWSTQMFDKNIVGTANALTAGWGNAGGGATYAIMVSLYNRLRKHTTQHRAWRLAFVCVPVPVLVTVAVATLVFGTDCPQGKWSLRHTSPATRAAVLAGHEVHLDSREREAVMNKKRTEGDMQVREVDMDAPEPVQDTRGQETVIRSDIDVAVAEPLTMKTFVAVLANPITWLPTLAYMTTFGFELAVDSNLASVLLAPHPTLGQLNAGYLASIFGLLNIITRPLGGYFADLLYRKYGTPAVKKHFVLALGCLQGVLTLGFGGLLISSKSPSLAGMMILIVCIAFCNEFANGANFSLVPHANSFNSGFMSGMVGAAGNLGGVFYALMFRYLPQQGHGWLAAGGFALGVNALLFLLPSPKR